MSIRWFEQTLADVPVEDDWLSRCERLRLQTLRIPKRRADWRLGRWTSKLAIADHLDLRREPQSLAAIELRPSSSGAPKVFLSDNPAELSISLTHRAGRAACVIAETGAVLGCDLELVEPRTDAFVADYFTAQEQALAAQAQKPDRDELISLIWSAKESALKALSIGLRIDTRSVAVTVTPADDSAVTIDAWLLAPQFVGQPWRRFRVTCGQQGFPGFWFRKDQFVRTLISTLPPRPTGPPKS